jgi:small conductance mechanosensitive channel
MMPYSEDFPRVKEIILTELKSIEKVLSNPEPEVGIIRFDANNVIVAVRPYVYPDDYWDVYYESLARIKKAFSENHVGIAHNEGLVIGKIGK